MSTSYMKKWEEKNRMRSYKKRIQSAKSIVSKTSLPNQRVVEVKSPVQTVYSTSDDLETYPNATSADNSDTTRPSSSKLSDYYSFEKENLTQIPLYRLLKHFSLQQYAKALISRGYGYDLMKLGGLNKEKLDTVIADIKMLPGHKVKFFQLVSQISQLCSEIIEQESMNFSIEKSPGSRKASYPSNKPSTAQAGPGGRQVYRSTPKMAQKKPSSALPGRRPLSTKGSNFPSRRENTMESVGREREGKKDNKTTIMKLEAIGPDYFADSSDSTNDQFSLILNDILEKYQNSEESHKEKPQEQPRVPLQPKKTNIQSQETGDLIGRVDKLYGNENKPKPTQSQAVKTQVTNKPVQKLSMESKGKIRSNEATRPESAAKQDKGKTIPEKLGTKPKQSIQKTEEIKQFEKSPEMKARVLDLLEKKLDPKNLNKDDLNLEVKKIKDLYTSFDGAKMTSTMANIDIEEMCYCFSCAIQKHIEHFIESGLPLEGSLPAQQTTNEKKVYKDANKENEKGSKINKQEQKGLKEVKEVKEAKPKQKEVKEVKEQKTKEDVQYNDNDEYFIYKGKKIPIGAFEEKDQIENDPYPKSSNRTGSRYEDEDEVQMEEDDEDLYGNEEYEEDDEKLGTIAERDTENADYNEEQFNDFLRQSLRENLMDTMKRGNTLSAAQIEAERSRLNQMCGNKANIQKLQEGNSENYGEDEELEEEIEEEEEEHSEFSFTMEESQYRELELSAEEFDQVKRVKRLFEKTYNEKNLTAEDYNKRIKDTVGKEAISNFCKNLMITSKMEKEVIIVSLVYVERLIIKTNMYLNSANWRRICFIAFILASKIWDDESFENEHFAKVFPQYSTREINELEKVFLELIDYDLRVNGSEYAKYYFILRTFAEKNKKSFSLKPMNVQIVRMMQNKVEGTTQSLKEKYSENTNRSFA